MSRIRIAIAGATLVALAFAVADSFASSHREAPLIANDPTADNTDLYVFVSPEDSSRVVVLWNYIPLEEPAGGPNFNLFDPNVNYDFYVDNDGDALEDVGYSFRFKTTTLNPDTYQVATGAITSLDDTDYNVRQFYDVFELRFDKKGKLKKTTQLNATPVPVPPPNIGPVQTPNYETVLGAAAVTTLTDGSRVFAGPRDEGFFVDLGAVFDGFSIRSGFGNMAGGKDGTAGFNVHTCAMELSIADLTTDGLAAAQTAEPVLGFYSTASRRTTTVLSKKGKEPKTSGKRVQVSRLANPLVNEVVIPRGMKDRFNASLPRDDAQFLDFVQNPEVADILNARYSAFFTVPAENRADLVAVFLTGVSGLNQPQNVVPCELMRLNVSIAPKDPGDVGYSALGVIGGDLSGYPNGRRVGDDVVDITYRVAAGILFESPPGMFPFNVAPNNLLGDGVDANDVAFLDHFPFLGPPQQGFENVHGKQN